VDVYFVCDDWEGEVSNEEPEKHAEISWFPAHDLPESTIDFVEEVIESGVSEDHYMEIGFEER
jgi:hypothetical protein